MIENSAHSTPSYIRKDISNYHDDKNVPIIFLEGQADLVFMIKFLGSHQSNQKNKNVGRCDC